MSGHLARSYSSLGNSALSWEGKRKVPQAYSRADDCARSLA
jgi:hypothetical protein